MRLMFGIDTQDMQYIFALTQRHFNREISYLEGSAPNILPILPLRSLSKSGGVPNVIHNIKQFKPDPLIFASETPIQTFVAHHSFLHGCNN